jgi:hypothetical protein
VDAAVLASPSGSLDRLKILQFRSFGDAAEKLLRLGDGYEGHRDDLMRQQLLLDIPLVGLTAATVANGIFSGPKDLTLALGLASATVGAGKLYFGPQVRTAAYSGAGHALLCAAGVANEMATLQSDYGTLADSTLSELEGVVAAANRLLSASLGATERASLLAARDRGQKAAEGLSVAVDLLSSGPARLQVFAITVLRNATHKILTGTQNLDAALALIRAVQPGPAGKTGGRRPADGRISLD